VGFGVGDGVVVTVSISPVVPHVLVEGLLAASPEYDACQ
jgi:hypothetical protein